MEAATRESYVVDLIKALLIGDVSVRDRESSAVLLRLQAALVPIFGKERSKWETYYQGMKREAQGRADKYYQDTVLYLAGGYAVPKPIFGKSELDKRAEKVRDQLNRMYGDKSPHVRPVLEFLLQKGHTRYVELLAVDARVSQAKTTGYRHGSQIAQQKGLRGAAAEMFAQQTAATYGLAEAGRIASEKKARQGGARRRRHTKRA